jgi:hypothetical protein
VAGGFPHFPLAAFALRGRLQKSLCGTSPNFRYLRYFRQSFLTVGWPESGMSALDHDGAELK